jgi:thioredoxin reductase (NADPH)
MQTHPDIEDAIIVGAGPAGLAAAVYLGRFRRRCVVLEDGASRARWIPTSHNIPGFAAGIGGVDLLSSLQEQALKYGAQIRRAHVTSLSLNEGIFTVQTEERALYSRYVLLATGVKDTLPNIAGVPEAVMRSLLRFCPICDAFEAIDKRIAVIGDGALGEREAQFLTNYSDRVTLLDIRPPGAAPAAGPGPAADSLRSHGIERIPMALSDVRILEDRVELASGKHDFDVVYLALGCRSQHDLALALRATCDEKGALVVNAHGETSVAGLYAAGDVVRGLNQVVVAAAESAIAATDIHNKLRAAEGRAR